MLWWLSCLVVKVTGLPFATSSTSGRPFPPPALMASWDSFSYNYFLQRDRTTVVSFAMMAWYEFPLFVLVSEFVKYCLTL
jgi:hypothetical protein